MMLCLHIWCYVISPVLSGKHSQFAKLRFFLQKTHYFRISGFFIIFIPSEAPAACRGTRQRQEAEAGGRLAGGRLAAGGWQAAGGSGRRQRQAGGRGRRGSRQAGRRQEAGRRQWKEAGGRGRRQAAGRHAAGGRRQARSWRLAEGRQEAGRMCRQDVQEPVGSCRGTAERDAGTAGQCA